MRRLLAVFSAIALAAVLQAETLVDGQFDRTLKVNGTVDLDASTHSGGITVTKGAAGTVRIHAILRANDDWFSEVKNVDAHIRELERNPPIEQTGNSIRVGYLKDPELLDGLSMHLDIEVPTTTQVHANTHSGGIQVSGVHGPVNCQTHSGGIDLRDIEGDVTTTAHSGGIHVSRLKGALVANTHSGGIDAYNVSGSIDVVTNSGGIRLSQDRPAPIRAHASSGLAWITLAAGAGYTLDANVRSGRISAPEMIVRGSFTRNHMVGAIRGGGPQVTIETGSGNIRVD